jgi:hypothetical protein
MKVRPDSTYSSFLINLFLALMSPYSPYISCRSLLYQLSCLRSRRHLGLFSRQVNLLSPPSLISFKSHPTFADPRSSTFAASSLQRWSASSRPTRPLPSSPSLHSSSTLLSTRLFRSSSPPTTMPAVRSTPTSPASSSSLKEEIAPSLSRPVMF